METNLDLYNQLVIISKFLQIEKTSIEKKSKDVIEKIENETWMESLFGFDDTRGDKNIFMFAKSNLDKNQIIKKLLQSYAIYDSVTGKLTTPGGKYDAGWFITPTVGLLKSTLNLFKPNVGNTSIYIIQGKDVGLAHIESEPYESFQGASQLNALEMINMDKTPYDGISNYILDNTQGPRVALSCAPGTLIRNYWYPDQLGSQFNALEKLGVSHINGYLVWGTNPDKIFDKISGHTDNIMIPCMIYTQVVGVVNKVSILNKHILNKHVHQIYSSAVPVNTYRNGGDLDIQNRLAEEIIRAQYVGVIAMGLILHEFDKASGRSKLDRAKINITLIGTGVFNVSENIVIDIIGSIPNNEFKGWSFDLYIHGYSEATASNIEKRIFGSKRLNPPNEQQLIHQLPQQQLPQQQLIQQLPQQQLIQQQLIQQLPQQQLIQQLPQQQLPQQQLIQQQLIQQQLLEQQENKSYLPKGAEKIDVLNYVLAVPDKNFGVRFFTPKSYQDDLLRLIIFSDKDKLDVDFYRKNKSRIQANLFRKITNNNQYIYGFINVNGDVNYFVDLSKIQVFKIEEKNNEYFLYDVNGNRVTKFNDNNTLGI